MLLVLMEHVVDFLKPFWILHQHILIVVVINSDSGALSSQVALNFREADGACNDGTRPNELLPPHSQLGKAPMERKTFTIVTFTCKS